MSFRRKKSDVIMEKKWDRFLADNQRIVEQAGLPVTVTENLDRFFDFIMHGYIDHHDDPMRFTIDQLNDDNYKKLMKLLEKFCQAGFMEQAELPHYLYYLKRQNIQK